jgi:archaeosine synthase
MQFKLEKTDEIAQTGKIKINNEEIKTPNIIFLNTNRFKAPDFAEITITDLNKNSKNQNCIFIDKSIYYPIFSKDLSFEIHNEAIKNQPLIKQECFIIPGNKQIINDLKINDKVRIYVILNSYQLYKNPKKLVEYLIDLRKKISYDQLIYVPSIGNPQNIAILTYLGIDFIDSTQAIDAARNKLMFFTDGNKKIKEIFENPCKCPICDKKKLKELTFNDILNHNYNILSNEIKKVRNAIKNQTLRELVEQKASINPNLTTLLRYIDQIGFEILEKRSPVYRNKKLNTTTLNAMNRSEIRRFQKRVLEQYIKPESAKILLIIPCSSKKPYSFSKSHKRFNEAIFSTPNPYIFHELIITSPLGIVPRELELIYPASSYDIPVTGIWFKDERYMIKNLLKKYLNNNHYEKIIIHLSETTESILKDIIPDYISTNVINSPGSNDSIKKLQNTLSNEIDSYEKVSGKKRYMEIIKAMASFQFTQALANSLINKTKITGKYPFLKIIDKNNNQLGMTTKDRGFISLTLNGAKRLLKHNQFFVNISIDFILKGSVFAPGVTSADKNIRIGDEVLVIQNNDLIAVGVAQMNGEEMKSRSHGEAVKIRHKAD